MPDSKPLPIDQPASGADLVRLVRTDQKALRARLRELTAAQVASLVTELAPGYRDELLSLVENPQDVVPLLPETELASTIRATGMADGSWLLEFASPEQRQACVDLDCWRGPRLSSQRLGEWIDALIAAGPRTLLAGTEDIDPELWVLALREMADIVVVSRDEPPLPGYYTEDGVVYYAPHSEAGFDRIREIFCTTLSESPQRYWQLVYGTIYESPAECEEYALRWHRNRLNDLGFPDRDRALRAYTPLRAEDAPIIETVLLEHEGSLARTAPLPQRLAGTLVGRALAELPAELAADVLGYVLAVANALAVADGLMLSDPESVPRALTKAVRGIDRGLAELATARGQAPHEVLAQTLPFDLFRIGATLDEELRPRGRSLADIEEDEETPDFDVEIEILDPEDP